MADSKISALPAASGVDATDIFPGDPLATAPTSKFTAAQMATFFWASPNLVTPNLGTPSGGDLTSCTNFNAANLGGTASGITLWMSTPTSNNLKNAMTDETGTGALVFATSPTLVTPDLGTPSAGVGTNLTGTAAGLTAGVATVANGLKSATTTVSVSAATAPTANQVLTATDSTHATWQTPGGGSGTVTHTGTLTANALMLGNAGADITALGSLGTTTTVLHGNAAGAPTFAAVNLATDVTGVLPMLINAQTGGSYTIVAGDQGKLVTFSNSGTVGITLPQATGSFTTGWSAVLQNVGTGVVTITPTTSTIDGAASLVLYPGQGVMLASDGTNYSTFRGTGLSSGRNQLVAGAILNSAVPTVDGTATGPTTNSFNSGYSSSAVGDCVYLDSSATWQKTDANTVYDGLLGIALEVKASGSALLVALPGAFVHATGFPTFTIGGPVYMSETAGVVTQTKPTTTDSATRVLGWGVHADKMYFFPSPDYITHT